MCEGKECPMKNKCYRHRAIPNTYQHFFIEPPFKEGECEEFWPLEKGMRLREPKP